MEIPLLADLVIILGLAVLVILAFQRLNLPNILGFLLSGAIAGPYGLSLVQASHEVDILAEIGVILLLFVIGLQFSLKSLAAIKRAVFIGGGLQVLITIGVVALLAIGFGYETGEAIFLGFLFSLSSTAIVLKLLQERGELTAPHGKFALAILIFQDIIVVPMILFTPIIAGESKNVWISILTLGLKGLGLILVVILSARYVVPRLLYQVAKTKSKELFILTIVVICFAVAWLTSSFGLSLPLGAFMAGLIISESDYSHQATANVLPFREIFTSIFFVSIGMLLDLGFLFQNLPLILVFTIFTIVIKGIICTVAALILKYPPRTFILVGLSLFQVGEFAFILSKTGIEYDLIAMETYQYFLSISILTMAATPFLIKFGDRITSALLDTSLTGSFFKRLFRNVHTVSTPKSSKEEELKDHIIIIGYGVNGRNVAKAAQNSNIPYSIIELNAETVREEKRKGEPIVYGDAIHDEILHSVNLHKARVIVVAISDPSATKKIILNIRESNKHVYIIVRTRFLNEIDENLRLGADEVIPEEFETSIEIFNRVLTKYLVPKDEIEDFTRSLRADNYEMYRELGTNRQRPFVLPEMEISALKVINAPSGIAEKTLEEANIRNHYKVTVVAIKRDDQVYYELTADTKIHFNDVLYVIGKPEDIAILKHDLS